MTRPTGRWVPAAIIVATVGLLSFAVVSGMPADAAYPGKNGLIVFDDLGARASSVQTIGPDGSGQSGVGPFTDAAYAAWSADGERIAFVRLAEGRAEEGIWIMNADGSDARQVTSAFIEGTANIDYDHLSPAWSPDGDVLLFEYRVQYSFGDGTVSSSGIARVQAGGGDPVFVISPQQGGDTYEDPVYSPAGGRFAYVSAAESNTGGDEIWTAALDGTDRRQLTRTESPKERPDWSPDGTRIVYQEGTNTVAEIAIVSAGAVQDTSPQRITDNGGFDGLPVWSPDGSRIAFLVGSAPVLRARSAPAGSLPVGLFTIRPDGSGLTGPLTNLDRTPFDTDWQALEPPPPPPTRATTPSTSPPTTGPGFTIPLPLPLPLPLPPVLAVDRPVTHTGEVPTVRGFNFPPDTDVLIRWDPGIGTVEVRSDATGGFSTQFLVMGRDELGNRLAVAEIGGVVQATAPILVVANTFQPAGLDSAMIARR